MPNSGSVVPNGVLLRNSSQSFHSAVALTPASSPSTRGTPNSATLRSGSSAER